VTGPRLCLTSDIDWTSEFAVQYFLDLVNEYGVKPTVFATHRSPVLDAAAARGAVELGIHPNFMPGSTHGSGTEQVVDHLCGLFPAAQSFRSHLFHDDTLLTDLLAGRGFTHDSNVCLFLQPGLVPLKHHSGLLRFPVFWEDDVHFRNTGGDWTLDRYLAQFTSPGLKVLNVHPFMVAANIPTLEYYRSVKQHITTLCPETLADVRYHGEGVETFLRQLLAALTGAGERFVTLGELYREETSQDPTPAAIHGDVVTGRQALHSAEAEAQYATLSDAEKQEFVRREFEDRNPVDPYATSRDYNMRELEIAAIAAELAARKPSALLDLGCGNGYTAISLAQQFAGWNFTGVDFALSLVDGAHELASRHLQSLRSTVSFVCADALDYIAQLPAGAVGYVLTERFLQNLPSPRRQEEALTEIHRVLEPGGRLLMCEGSADGFERLNDLRAAVGLSRIPATSRENVTAIRFDDEQVESDLRRIGFELVGKRGFSTYFMVARVLHPLLVAPRAPRFDARINDEAFRLQRHAPFVPGYGGSVLWVCEKPVPSSV
jgi:ubiquinone/menaquinone biosynthesis C-methylase UbiE